MKKKRIITIALTLIMILTSSAFAFAGENQVDQPVVSPQISVEFGMEALPDENQYPLPRKTFYGNGGSCALDYMQSARAIVWRVTPGTSAQFSFLGEVEIYRSSDGRYMGWGMCNESGGITSLTGIVGVANMNLQSGVSYRAEFTGVATDMFGTRYGVVPGASLPFVY